MLRAALALAFLLFLGTRFAEIKIPQKVQLLLGIDRPLVRIVQQFPPGTWINDIAVDHDGQLLVTFASAPEVWLVGPEGNIAKLVHRFEGTTSASGIAELKDDVFVVTAGNWSVERLGERGSWSMWTINTSPHKHDAANITKVADVPELRSPTGIAALPSKTEAVVVADASTGMVYRIDVWTGERTVIPTDALLEPTEYAPVWLGVSSIAVRNLTPSRERSGTEDKWYLYFTRTFGDPSLGRISLNVHGEEAGKAAAPAEEIVRRTPGNVEVNDFAIDREGTIWLAASISHGILSVDEKSQAQIPVELSGNNAIGAATAVAFGRRSKDRDILYVATREGVSRPIAGNEWAAKIVAIDTSQLRIQSREY
ncbi:uncharacterized protein LTR77_011186 [Saxophila tyrrhenica]|uniref:Uncharacterized protein n=1 Tax=Saxophila tyrrhenica TaxID=1690608 RepID=A0AAV9NTQ8_9PEZI|nr:hypothetical protein LTR77_011186 [Saxophila tyrrhenica]